ncbi:MAG: hypothetical protein GX817_04300 [Elusimicrobia bacterium]|nr:hypothetical protein [Elusimicrobiota bacterium]
MQKFFILYFIFFGFLTSRPSYAGLYDGQHSEVFLELSEHFDPEILSDLFKDPRFEIYKRTAPAQKQYNKITVEFYKRPAFGLFTEAGYRAGRKFVEEYKDDLLMAIRRFSLPEEAIWDIAGLAGVEYSWGKMKPPHKIFNALISLYRDVPGRRKFALDNIEGLLRGMEDPFIRIDPYAPSSFLGGAGYCQMMPFWFTTVSDWRRKERLDIDDDGIFDPYHMPDAIGFFAWRLSAMHYRRDRFNAIKRYNGSGSAAKAFAEAIMEYSKIIQSGP